MSSKNNHVAFIVRGEEVDPVESDAEDEVISRHVTTGYVIFKRYTCNTALDIFPSFDCLTNSTSHEYYLFAMFINKAQTLGLYYHPFKLDFVRTPFRIYRFQRDLDLSRVYSTTGAKISALFSNAMTRSTFRHKQRL